jgi:hypothetical protein
MELLTQIAVSRGLRAGATAGFLGLALVTGCLPDGQFVTRSLKPGSGKICQAVMTWKHEVAFAPDPLHEGHPTPGIAGRLYLFGPEIGYPELHEGTLIVDLYDEAPTADGGEPVLLEKWKFDKETLKQLQKRDIIGWGYTVFLPWSTYRPGSMPVRLRYCFQPVKGAPIYDYSDSFILEGPLVKGQQVQAASKQLAPAAPKAATTTATVMADGGR